MSRASGIATVFGLGVMLMLAASPASAICAGECTCATSCDQECRPSALDEVITCEEWGRCIGSEGCTGPCTTCTSTINGTSGGDTLNGGSAHECINGLGGADTISGDAGDDTLHGGDGNDTLYGGSGYDCADGGTGTDFCDAEYEINCGP